MQYGSSDCGLFSIAFATAIALGNNPATFHFKQSEMRQHLIKCFDAGAMTMFPYDKMRRLTRKVKKSDTIKIYCKCRLPKMGTMIICSDCKEWYHLDMCQS